MALFLARMYGSEQNRGRGSRNGSPGRIPRQDRERIRGRFVQRMPDGYTPMLVLLKVEVP